ncbi:MAG: hypothetical protein AAF039_00760 [Bacteroidota bacterium]
MKSTLLKFFVFGVLTLGAVSCTNTDHAETEELYIDSPDGENEHDRDDRDGNS